MLDWKEEYTSNVHVFTIVARFCEANGSIHIALRKTDVQCRISSAAAVLHAARLCRSSRGQPAMFANRHDHRCHGCSSVRLLPHRNRTCSGPLPCGMCHRLPADCTQAELPTEPPSATTSVQGVDLSCIAVVFLCIAQRLLAEARIQASC